MSRNRSLALLGLAAVPAAALAVAGCGGGGGGGGGATAASPPSETASRHAATLGVANSGLGNILVDSQGRTVYLFRKDSGTKSTCSAPGRRLAAGPREPEAERRRRSEPFASGNDQAVGRNLTDHLQRPPAVPVHR